MRLLATILAAATGVGLAAAWVGPAAAAAPAPGPAVAAGPAVRTVRLVTGDLVTVGTDGDRVSSVAVQPRDRTGLAAQFVGLRRAGEQYLFPVAVLPYLRHGLDPALFDVTQLARAGGTTPADRIAVGLTYRPGAAHRAIPGIAVTRTDGDTAEGYLTAASARIFGAALLARTSAHQAPDPSVIPGLISIRPAGAPAGTTELVPRATADAATVTVRIKLVGPNAKPVPEGLVFGIGLEATTLGGLFNDTVNGETEFDAPVGTYGLTAIATDPETGVAREVNVVDYRVTGLTPTQTLTIDMGRASEPITASTPKPASFAFQQMFTLWSDETGLGLGFEMFTLDPQQAPILVAPAPASQVGTLSYAADVQYVSPPGVGVPYTYSLAFGGQAGIPAGLHHTVTDAELTTVENTYFTDGGPPGQQGRTQMSSSFPWQDLSTSGLSPFTLPGKHIDYVTGREDLEWRGFYLRDAVDANGTSASNVDGLADSARRYEAGQQVRVDWGRQPVHPGFAVQTAKTTQTIFCPDCRGDDRMRIEPQPLQDSAGHRGLLVGSRGDTPLGPVDGTGRIQLFAGDTKLGEAGASQSGLVVTVPAASTRYRLLLDQNRLAPWVSTGIRSHTEWGFTSAHPIQSTAPHEWICVSGLGDPPAACVVLPLLTVNYAAPVGITGVAAGGPTHLGVTVAPTQAAPTVTIAAVTVEVSFDDGTTFTPATVTGSAGHYDAAFTAPTSGFVTTRVQATDSAGNTVSQTITRGYALGPAA